MHLSAKSAYMRDQIFQGIISAIPIIIILVFVLLPFSANGWDVGRTVLPANPFAQAGSSDIFRNLGGDQLAGGSPEGGSPVVSVRDSGISGTGQYFLELQLRNPLPMQVDVKEFTATAPLGSTTVNLAMAAPVSIPAGSTGLCRLEGTLRKGASQNAARPSVSDLRNLRMTISSGGADVTLDENTIRGMLQ